MGQWSRNRQICHPHTPDETQISFSAKQNVTLTCRPGTLTLPCTLTTPTCHPGTFTPTLTTLKCRPGTLTPPYQIKEKFEVRVTVDLAVGILVMIFSLSSSSQFSICPFTCSHCAAILNHISYPSCAWTIMHFIMLSSLFRIFNCSVRIIHLICLSNESNMVSLIDYSILVDDGMVPIFDSVTYN